MQTTNNAMVMAIAIKYWSKPVRWEIIQNSKIWMESSLLVVNVVMRNKKWTFWKHLLIWKIKFSPYFKKWIYYQWINKSNFLIIIKREFRLLKMRPSMFLLNSIFYELYLEERGSDMDGSSKWQYVQNCFIVICKD